MSEVDYVLDICNEENIDKLKDLVLNLSFCCEGHEKDRERWRKEKAELEGTIDDLRGDLRRAENRIDDYRSEIYSLEGRIDYLSNRRS